MADVSIREAKAELSKLIARAQGGEAVRITKRGQPVGVLISTAEYGRLVAPKASLVDFFRDSPLAEAAREGLDLDFERPAEIPREFDV